jgi:superfamily II DNA/RNA helicase
LKFNEFNLDARLLEGIEAIGFETATPIQASAIPVIMQGRDVIASAQTGTGKTAAFLLPIIHLIQSQDQDHHLIKALIIVPTRELAIQIDQQMEGLSYFTSLSSIAVYGGGDGASFAREKQALSEGADVVICTPGRMQAHLNLGYVKVSGLKHLILDEADRMLDMGFFDDIMKIISNVPKERQTLLFSATMPTKIRELSKKILNDPEEITIALSKPPENIAQFACMVYDNQKIPLVKHILTSKPLKSVIVFCSTKVSAKALSRDLQKEDLSVKDIHSDLEQDERKRVLNDFKSNKLNVLVATDILSRGIDIEDIDLVINYDVPNDAEDYIHRIGRTARAEAKGVAFTFVTEKEQYQLAAIERLLGKPVPKVKLPAHIGEAPKYDPSKNRGGGGGRPFKKGKKAKR